MSSYQQPNQLLADTQVRSDGQAADKENQIKLAAMSRSSSILSNNTNANHLVIDLTDSKDEDEEDNDRKLGTVRDSSFHHPAATAARAGNLIFGGSNVEKIPRQRPTDNAENNNPLYALAAAAESALRMPIAPEAGARPVPAATHFGGEVAASVDPSNAPTKTDSPSPNAKSSEDEISQSFADLSTNASYEEPTKVQGPMDTHDNKPLGNTPKCRTSTILWLKQMAATYRKEISRHRNAVDILKKTGRTGAVRGEQIASHVNAVAILDGKSQKVARALYKHILEHRAMGQKSTENGFDEDKKQAT